MGPIREEGDGENEKKCNHTPPTTPRRQPIEVVEAASQVTSSTQSFRGAPEKPRRD